MKILLSPSKTQDFESKCDLKQYSQPRFMAKSKELVAVLKGFSEKELGELMMIGSRLASLNVERYKGFVLPKTPREGSAKQAICAFKGDVYTDIQVSEYTPEDFVFAQGCLRIISGLYGLLKPLDLIAPYRLEMKTKLQGGWGKNLYDFWGNFLTESLREDLQKDEMKVVLNLASEEYARAIDKNAFGGCFVNIVFKQKRGGEYKVVPIFAKRARGTMANHIVRKRLKSPEEVKNFAEDGYCFAENLSDGARMVFLRN